MKRPKPNPVNPRHSWPLRVSRIAVVLAGAAAILGALGISLFTSHGSPWEVVQAAVMVLWALVGLAWWRTAERNRLTAEAWRMAAEDWRAIAIAVGATLFNGEPPSSRDQ